MIFFDMLAPPVFSDENKSKKNKQGMAMQFEEIQFFPELPDESPTLENKKWPTRLGIIEGSTSINFPLCTYIFDELWAGWGSVGLDELSRAGLGWAAESPQMK